MDHPAAVTHLVVLDSVPIGEALARCDASFAEAWWHWFFLGNPAADAERVITADPDAWYRVHGKQEHMGRESWTDFTDAIRDPATVHAMCEDYRAGLTVDRAHDDADKCAGRRVTCPTLVGWATRDDMEQLYGDPVAVWRDWADTVTGTRIESGHHIAEEEPAALANAVLEFLRENPHGN